MLFTSFTTSPFFAVLSTCTTHDSSPSKSLGALGGNQRDQDRLKAQKKAAANKTKPKESAASLAKRREADADALRRKQKKAGDPKAGGTNAGGNKAGGSNAGGTTTK